MRGALQSSGTDHTTRRPVAPLCKVGKYVDILAQSPLASHHSLGVATEHGTVSQIALREED